jgi:hypothetical protein
MRNALFTVVGGGRISSPRVLPTLNRWYDPSDASTLTLNTNKVTAIADKSGRAFDLGQSTDAFRPTTGNTINGVAALTFDGSDDVLASISINYFNAADVPFTLFFVAQATAVNVSDFIVTMTKADLTEPVYAFGYNSATAKWRAFKRDDANASKIIDGGTPDTNPHVFSFICSGTTGTLRVDGVSVATDADFNVGTMSVERFCLGARLVVTALDAFGGKLGEVFMTSSALSLSKARACERYLGKKWGILVA